MSFSSEIKEWATAAKELWQEENRKHPYARGLIIGFAVLYGFIHGFLDK